MRLLQFRPNGLNRQSTLKYFVALAVMQPPQRLKTSGLIGDRLFIRSIIAASGKNFINVNVIPFGGPGAAIALLATSERRLPPSHSRKIGIYFESASSAPVDAFG